MTLSPSYIARLAIILDRNSVPCPACGCTIWTANTTDAGYGRFSLGSRVDHKQWRAHRASWLVHRGPIPEGLHILHKCDFRLCINPDHLFPGTNADNHADMIAKGRQSTDHGELLRGQLNGMAKLTPEKVRQIVTDPRGCRLLAREHGIGRSTVKDIRTGRTWAHITRSAA